MKKTTFFSNEDLDNILRRMEGLTTDEKEAYLDARLKELESLPDSRKKELQEAARTGNETDARTGLTHQCHERITANR